MAILVLSMRILVSLRAQDLPHVAMLILYTLSVAALSLVSSANAAISLLKLLSFFLTSAAALVGSRHLSDMQRLGFVNSLVGVWIAAALLSLPTLAHSDIGFATNGEGFQGIFNHPQVLGVFFVPAVLFFIMQTLTHGRRLNLSASGAVLCGSLMALSLSRTAALACLLALVMTAAAAAIMPSTPSLRARMRLFMPLSLAASVVVIVIMGSPEVREEVDEFLFKGDRNLSEGWKPRSTRAEGKGWKSCGRILWTAPLSGTASRFTAPASSRLASGQCGVFLFQRLLKKALYSLRFWKRLASLGAFSSQPLLDTCFGGRRGPETRVCWLYFFPP